MTMKVNAVYEDGVLRPLNPLPLAEHERVTVTIGAGVKEPERSHLDVEFIEYARRELASVEHVPTLEEVRQMLSKDKSSWADLIIAEREDFNDLFGQLVVKLRERENLGSNLHNGKP
jgi:predicted DNA-binding antitoxin AbrB/MazE fold protein